MTSPLLRKPFGSHGKVHEITPASAGWRYVGFSLYRLRPGETAAEATGASEAILVMVEGKASLSGRRTGLGRARRADGRLREDAAALPLRPERRRLDGDGRDRLRARRLLGAR